MSFFNVIFDEYTFSKIKLPHALSFFSPRKNALKNGKNICIYPTAPFVTARKLQDAMQVLKENQADGVMPVVRFSFPPQRGMAIRNGRLDYCYPENAMKRSQDLEPMYHDCGQFYVYDVEKYRACRGDLPDGYFPIEVPETEVQDIDNLSDWKLAEIKYEMMEKSK